MAFTKRPRAPSFTTPPGTFRFPKLSEIDYGTKEYPNPEGSYSAPMILQAADAATQEFIGKLEPLHRAATAKGEEKFKGLKAEQRKRIGQLKVNPLYTEILDPDTEEPTGELLFKFSMKASGTYKSGKMEGKSWDKRPTVFDANKSVLIQGFREDRPADKDITDVHVAMKPDISGGTVGKVAFEVGLDMDGDPGYFVAGTGACGLSMRLQAVQVIDLVTRGQRSADDYGFGDESGGEAEDAPFDKAEADF